MKAFIQWEAGKLDEVGWERFRRTICINHEAPIFQSEFNFMIDQYTTTSFQEFREFGCSGGP